MNRLKELRKAKKLTQQELAEKNRYTLSNFTTLGKWRKSDKA